MHSSPIEETQDGESVPPAVPVAANRRWWMIAGALMVVAAVWIVASGGAFGRLQTPVVPEGAQTGPVETGPAETGPAETVPPRPPASAEPNVTRHRCSDGARSRLDLWDAFIEGLQLRFEVRDGPPGHLWHIRMWRSKASDPDRRVEWRRGAIVASDSGDFAVVRHPRSFDPDGGIPWVIFRVEAIDSATGQVCKVIGHV